MLEAKAALEVTERFSDRVEDYERARPGYPPAMLDWLIEQCGLLPGDPVADVGSGTGLLARSLAARGLSVTAVEPNAPMRAAAERAGPGIASQAGRAEATGLAPGSVRLITAAQAFHWFDPVPTRREFERILAPGGRVALIWNVRRDDTPFLEDYATLLRQHAPGYTRSGASAQADEAAIARFFHPLPVVQARFDNAQAFDREGLRARLISSSYVPGKGRPGHAEVLDACDAVFARHARDGEVAFLYLTRVFVGRLAPAGA